MKFNELNLKANKSKSRIGRGISAGQGKTAGRGTKGQGARTGSRKRPGFEGGQNPLMQRLPKMRGFRPVKPKAETVYTGQLNQLDGATADNFTLANAGIVSSPYVRVKLINKGDITKKMTVKLQSASESAVAAVQKAGGSVDYVPQVKRTAQKETEAV